MDSLVQSYRKLALFHRQMNTRSDFWILSTSSEAVTWFQHLHVAELVTYFLSRTQMHVAFSAMVVVKQMIG